ncbi:MAG: hypothetical protein IJ685_11175 [Selenomonadaceae bacterium]|nr:hypothetical protein [Selenomonadaceae bacterium]
MSIAIKGCQITRDKDASGHGTIHYKKICSACGYVLPGEGQHSGPLSRGNTFRTFFKCPKCGNKQDIEILGE